MAEKLAHVASLPGAALTAEQPRMLLAFDFDHTICQENTDLFILSLLGSTPLPSAILVQQDTLCWTDYMQAIFTFINQQGITRQQIHEHMRRTPLVHGMAEFFSHLIEHQSHYDCIIISDSNSLFIGDILAYCRLDALFPLSHIYTNPAHWDPLGCLRVDYFHRNNTCSFTCSPNLCKGRVLEEHIERVEEEHGRAYQTVVVIGDGANDLCASKRLRASDFVAARRGFRLLDKINREPTAVSARIVPWSDGHELLAFLRNLEMSPWEV